MKFRTQIMIAIWGVVLGVLLLASVVIQYWVRVQVVSRFGDDLRSNNSAVIERESLRSGEIIRSTQIVAESPRLKAVVETGDRNTAAQLCRELNQNIRSDLLLLTNGRGTPVVALSNGRDTVFDPAGFSSISRALRGVAAADVWAGDSIVYRTATVPITIGPDLVGTLTLGFRIRNEEVLAIESMTNSEVMMLAGRVPVTSTLDSSSYDLITGWLGGAAQDLERIRFRSIPAPITISTPDAMFIATWCRLNSDDPGQRQIAGYLLLKPVDREVEAVLSPILRTFVILSVIVLIFTGIIGYIISLGIARPIAGLVRATAEISRGNYDHRITAGGSLELKSLADRFDEMSKALKEKISELAERNRELESALQMLKDTQEELLKSERLAATGKMTAQLSHEINNPIHNIMSLLQTVLKRVPPDSPDRELLDAAAEEVHRLATLTRQMLDVYRESLVPFERKPVSLNRVIREIAASSGPALGERNVNLDLHLDESVPDVVGSHDKLKQVFLNLINNSRDAMPGGGTITIASSRSDRRVELCVTDTGTGIAPEHLSRIFDAFFTTKNRVSGVGLGLSVSYGIVRQHNGTISVRSSPGHGTTFTCTFPTPQSGT